MSARKLFAECLGTALLVFIAVGVATLSFGKWASGPLIGGSTGTSIAAGVVATALAFGLVLLILAYALGPISGCHVNPAVTIGFVVSGRMSIFEGISYWVAQLAGGIIGAGALYEVFRSTTLYSKSGTGLGTDGWGKHSMIGIPWGGAFAAEAILTFLFVLVVLVVTSRIGNSNVAGVAIGFALGYRAPDRHPDHRDVRQPGPQLGPRHLRGRRRPPPSVAVPCRTASRRHRGRTGPSIFGAGRVRSGHRPSRRRGGAGGNQRLRPGRNLTARKRRESA